MKCPRCGAANPEGAGFCEECGARVELACPSCGQPVGAGKKFCRSCGISLTPASPPARSVSPESYTPEHLAEKILTSKAALEGERKQVTVLFADLKGSMELLADRDPEDARKILDPVLELMMEAVHRYEGTVNQVMGDGIMALFGAPLAHEDHAVRACYAALRMQRRMNLYAEEVQRAGGTPAEIRAGLNSGGVVVRSIGSDLHMDYTAVGQTTHLAARMEQIAKAGSILITGETLRLAEGYVQVRPVGAVTVKGLEAPIQVYELTGLGLARSRLQATAARGLTRFVGRDTELQQLALALERAASGHGQIVAVVGEAGVGKSRLAWEFTHSHRTHEWLILESASVSYGKATPYLPVIELLKSYFKIQDRDDQREIRERVAGKLVMLDRAMEALLTPLLALLDVRVDDAAWDALDPPQRRQRTLDAVKRLLLRESQIQPLLLIFEDLHWIDSETQALLDGLISLRLSWLSEAYLIAGRMNDAIQRAHRALDLSSGHKERGDHAWILRLLGEIASHSDPSDVRAAEERYHGAMALANELGMRPLVTHCHLGLGKLYRRSGQREQAREHLITATTMYREMDMRFWLEQAEAAMDEAPR
jgi:class 3 adenylate cyclase